MSGEGAPGARTGLIDILLVARHGGLTHAQLHAWLLIRSYESPSPGCTASEETLAEMLGVVPRQWRRIVAQLRDRGFLDRTLRGPQTAALRTTLAPALKDRSLVVRARADAEGPGKPKRPDARPDVRPDRRPDAERPPSTGGDGGDGGGPPGFSLSERAFYAVVRKLILQGNIYGWTAWRGVEHELAGKLRIPVEALRVICASLEQTTREHERVGIATARRAYEAQFGPLVVASRGPGLASPLPGGELLRGREPPTALADDQRPVVTTGPVPDAWRALRADELPDEAIREALGILGLAGEPFPRIPFTVEGGREP